MGNENAQNIDLGGSVACDIGAYLLGTFSYYGSSRGSFEVPPVFLPVTLLTALRWEGHAYVRRIECMFRHVYWLPKKCSGYTQTGPVTNCRACFGESTSFVS